MINKYLRKKNICSEFNKFSHPTDDRFLRVHVLLFCQNLVTLFSMYPFKRLIFLVHVFII